MGFKPKEKRIEEETTGSNEIEGPHGTRGY